MTQLQVLETMGKLQGINAVVRLTINKLPGIKAELVINYGNKQEIFKHLSKS